MSNGKALNNRDGVTEDDLAKVLEVMLCEFPSPVQRLEREPRDSRRVIADALTVLDSPLTLGSPIV